MAAGKRFQLRVFTSLSLVTTGLVLACTGAICYLKPPSRIAEWIGWRFLGLEKGTWEALHTIFAWLFVMAALTHVIYNRKALWKQMRVRLEKGREHWRELTAAVGLTMAFILVTLLNIFPAGPIITLSDRLSEGWGREGNTPPIARIEKFSLETYCRLLEIDLQGAMRELRTAGLTSVSSDTPVREIAVANEIAPIEIGRMLERWAVPE
ncbi:DUF4405 domain-containing protein [Gemmatimonadota bacterium]